MAAGRVIALWILAVCVAVTSGVTRRPQDDNVASYARWLVHESDYGIVVSHHNRKDVIGNVISTCDGYGSESTGIVVAYIPDRDFTAHDLKMDRRVSVTFTEKAVEGSQCTGAAQGPACGRVAISGKLTLVPAENASEMTRWFDKRHPQGVFWGQIHEFKPYWIEISSITDIIVENSFNATQITVDEYVAVASDTVGPFPTILPTTAPLHPRPDHTLAAETARWLVHESDYAVVGTHHVGQGEGVLGHVLSISDGVMENSTGIIYTYISTTDVAYHDLMVDNRVSVAFSEKAIAGGQGPGCEGMTAETPTCVRLVVQGKMTIVPEANKSTAMKSIFAKHPEMENWSSSGEFVPFWVAPADISEFVLVPFYGGALHFTVEAYLEAPWYTGGPSPAPVPIPPPQESWFCMVCGHTYDPEVDGGGKRFEDLPDTWRCPVCGNPKSAYKNLNSANTGNVLIV